MTEEKGPGKRPPPLPPPPANRGAAERSLRLSEAREALLDEAPERALEICNTEMSPGEGDRRWLLLRAEVLVALDRDADALEDLIAILQGNHREAEAIYRIGAILLRADEPAHAERYLTQAVRLAGGKSSYTKTLKKAHRRALVEGSSIGDSNSELPAADDDLDADPQTRETKAHLRSALSALLAFERQAGLFDSRISAALGATRRRLPRWSDLSHSPHARRGALIAAIGSSIALIALIVGLLVQQQCESRAAQEATLGTVDQGIARGGMALRDAALLHATSLYNQDDDDADVAFRLAWLLAVRHLYDSTDSELLARARALLAGHADETRPRAVLAAAMGAVAAGHAPGGAVAGSAYDDPTLESMRHEVLAADALRRGNAGDALTHVTSGLKGRPRSIDLHVLAVEAALEQGQIKKAREWTKRAKELEPADPSVALAEAILLHRTGQPPQAVSAAMAPAVVETVSNRHRFRALALAMTLRAEIGEVGVAPPFDDLEAEVSGNPAQALAAAEALLAEGWPDYAERALKAAEAPAPPAVTLALEVASGRITRAAKLVPEAPLSATPLLRALAVQAASTGDLVLVDTCLARLEILGISPCALAATRARVALRRGRDVTPDDAKLLKGCPAAGPVLLWRVEHSVANKDRGLQKIDRRDLRLARGLGLESLATLGLYDLAKNEPGRADEAGRQILARCATSRAGLILRLRAAITRGDHHRALELYRDAADELREDPSVAGYAALARIARGEDRSVIAFLDKLDLESRKSGTGLVLATRAMARLNRRSALSILKELKKTDPSPYTQEAQARAYLTLGDLGQATAALERTSGAIERRLEHELLKAKIAFEKREGRRYRSILEEVEDIASGDLGNGPIATEARLRRVAVIEDHKIRRDALERLEESVDAWRRLDRASPRLGQLRQLMRRVNRRPLEFPK